MVRRAFSTLALAVLGLVVLAWPFSYAGLTCIVERVGAPMVMVSLTEGNVVYRSQPGRRATDLERDRYYLSGGENGRVGPFVWWPRRQSVGGTTVVYAPLWLPGAAAALVLVLLNAVRGITVWRRKRRGACLACGYGRIGEGECQECGLLPAAAAARAEVRLGRAARDAAVIMFVALLGLSCAGWWLGEKEIHSEAYSRAKAYDYSWYLQTCMPRLDGSVMYAAPGNGPDSLAAVLRKSGKGTTIVLLPGAHDLGGASGQPTSATELHNVWLMGCGRDQTTLSLHLSTVDRVRIEGMTIDCKNDPFVDLRSGGALYLRDCLVRNYNSGAGGSDGIFADDGVLLVEGCEFEGKSGRWNGGRGTAMDLRGSVHLFCRDTTFTNNQTILHSALGVMDGCSVTTDQSQWFFPPSGVSMRNVKLPATRNAMPGMTGTFTEALDDLGPLTALSDGKGVQAWSDLKMRERARVLGFGDEAPWGRLLLHPSPEVRALARKHVGGGGVEVAAVTAEEAVAELGRGPLMPATALRFLSQGESVRAVLESIRGGGSGTAPGNAAALLRMMGAQPSLPEVVGAQK